MSEIIPIAAIVTPTLLMFALGLWNAIRTRPIEEYRAEQVKPMPDGRLEYAHAQRLKRDSGINELFRMETNRPRTPARPNPAPDSSGKTDPTKLGQYEPYSWM